MPSGLLHQRTPPKDESQPRRKLGRILLWVEQNATFSSFSATHFVHRKNREKRRALGRALMDNCATRFWGIDSCAAQSREIKKPPSEYSGGVAIPFCYGVGDLVASSALCEMSCSSYASTAA